MRLRGFKGCGMSNAFVNVQWSMVKFRRIDVDRDTIHFLQFTFHNSPFTIRTPQFVLHNSPLTIHTLTIISTVSSSTFSKVAL